MVDTDAALEWAGSVLASPVVASEPLEGGLTSTMRALRHTSGSESVLRLMTEQPWRDHGAELTTRERDAHVTLADNDVPAPHSLALDADGEIAGAAAHLMSRLPGVPARTVSASMLTAMADMLVRIHLHRPDPPFRLFQSWAWEDKWVTPPWTRDPRSWERAFRLLAGPEPTYEPTFLHRDFSHRNLLWTDGAITGVVDWVETSTGPAWLDAGHAATNLAISAGVEPAARFLRRYAEASGTAVQAHWLVMDAVGFLPPPGRRPMFDHPDQLARLDAWLELLVRELR
ncbi:aminoglycoside phosphotransferase family protein [Nocardioides sp. S-58]|uniref:Aminoglycoside phosphotransferase family protein n=1 Tax=Nocardioides renjunii TaxID=3095075 RepID=A0ABU5KDH7_9ACTN|nr:aminoglycoside phosphotransferase family protein [Nocardioides sp. S-58]MDZ5662630.1 aminoglycoside phosphotransferase family protein [Nocardioides sp. S-58]